MPFQTARIKIISAKQFNRRAALKKINAGYILKSRFVHGAVAQLGERDVRNVEARGSIPLSSTNASVCFLLMRGNSSNNIFYGVPNYLYID
jgi:hypothetical protein